MSDSKLKIFDIQTFLDSTQNYREGLDLFCKYSKNKYMQKYLSRKKNPKKLIYELKKLINQNINIPNVQQPVTNDENKYERRDFFKITKDGKIDWKDLPEILQQYYLKNAEEHKLMRALHEKMKLAENDDTRAELRNQIVEYDNTITERWNVIDRYIATGEMPEPEQEPKPAADITPKEVSASRAAISRYIEKLETDKLEAPEKEKIIQKLQNRVTRMISAGQSFAEDTLNKIKKFGANITNND
jgi:hypothetical protein